MNTVESLEHQKVPEQDDYAQLRDLLRSIDRANKERRVLGVVVVTAIITMAISIYLIFNWRTKGIEELGVEVAGNRSAVIELTRAVSPEVVRSLPSPLEAQNVRILSVCANVNILDVYL